MRIRSTLLRPDAGTSTVVGIDVASRPADVRERISLTGQFAGVDEVLTGRENLVLMAHLRHLRGARTIADDLLARFQLADVADRRVDLLSRRRRRPPELAGRGTTVLLTTQYLDEAEQLADRIAILHEGRSIANGTLAQLRQLLPPATVEDTIITTTLMPIAFLLVFVYVLGGSIDTGSDQYVTYLLPGILLITIASSISFTSFRLFLDMNGGIVERFQSLPIARSSLLWAPVLTSLVPFISSAFVLTETMPGPVRAFAENQPVTPIVNTIRDLPTEQPVSADIWIALGRCLAILVAGYALAMASCHRRTAGGGRRVVAR